MKRSIDPQWLKIIGGFVVLILFGISTSDSVQVNAFVTALTSPLAEFLLSETSFCLLFTLLIFSCICIVAIPLFIALKRCDYDSAHDIFWGSAMGFVLFLLPIMDYLSKC